MLGPAVNQEMFIIINGKRQIKRKDSSTWDGRFLPEGEWDQVLRDAAILYCHRKRRRFDHGLPSVYDVSEVASIFSDVDALGAPSRQ